MKRYSIVLTVALIAATLALHTLARRVVAPHAGDIPTVLKVTVMPRWLSPTDTATMAATLYNAGRTQGPYTAILQLQPWGGGITLTRQQGGILLRRRQVLTVYWEWRAGPSLPPQIYRVRIRLRLTAGPDHMVTGSTAETTLTVLPR